MTVLMVSGDRELTPVARMVDRMFSARFPGEKGLEMLLELGVIEYTYGCSYDADDYRTSIIGRLNERQLNGLIEFLLEDNPV